MVLMASYLPSRTWPLFEKLIKEIDTLRGLLGEVVAKKVPASDVLLAPVFFDCRLVHSTGGVDRESVLAEQLLFSYRRQHVSEADGAVLVNFDYSFGIGA
jgi:hypothetical protein